MKEAMNTWSAQLAGMLGITAATFGVFLYAEGIGSALVGGIGDQRVRALYSRSVAFVGSVMAFLLPTWWLVTVSLGEPNETLSLLCAIFAVLWVGAVLVLSRRG